MDIETPPNLTNQTTKSKQSPKKSINPYNLSNRFERIPQETIQQLRQNLYASFKAVHRIVAQKNLWRPEIIKEINEFIQDQMSPYLQEQLLQKELEEYNLILKLTKKKTDGSQNWYLIKLKKEKKQEFLGEIDQGKITIQNLDTYGKILYKGQGEQIPKFIQKDLEREYFMQMRNKAIEINSKAYQLTREKKYHESIQLYTKSLRYDKMNSTAYNNRAYCNIMVKKHDVAEDDLKKCLKIDNKFENAYKHLATIYLDKQKLHKSLSFVNQALDINPNYPEALHLKNIIQNKIQEENELMSKNKRYYTQHTQEEVQEEDDDEQLKLQIQVTKKIKKY